jgi:hypothetical protein
MMPTIGERCPTNATDRNAKRTREAAANAVLSALSSLRMEGCKCSIDLPVGLDPLAAQALAASERALARNAFLRLENFAPGVMDRLAVGWRFCAE